VFLGSVSSVTRFEVRFFSRVQNLEKKTSRDLPEKKGGKGSNCKIAGTLGRELPPTLSEVGLVGRCDRMEKLQLSTCFNYPVWKGCIFNHTHWHGFQDSNRALLREVFSPEPSQNREWQTRPWKQAVKFPEKIPTLLPEKTFKQELIKAWRSAFLPFLSTFNRRSITPLSARKGPSHKSGCQSPAALKRPKKHTSSPLSLLSEGGYVQRTASVSVGPFQIVAHRP
jgi:hypothetical protein